MDPTTAEHGNRSRDRDRLIGVSDAVVAIAATLLVLPLVDIAPNEDVTDVRALLVDNTSIFLSFVLSFVLIYRFWLVHRQIMSQVTELTMPLVWLNGVWLHNSRTSRTACSRQRSATPPRWRWRSCWPSASPGSVCGRCSCSSRPGSCRPG
jgi:hypothetical protein